MCALGRSRRLALTLTIGLWLGTVIFVAVQPIRSVSKAAAPPLRMEMRALPLPVSPVIQRPPQNFAPILAEQSTFSVFVPPEESTLVVQEEAAKQEKPQVQEAKATVPKVRVPRPASKATPASPPVGAVASLPAAAAPPDRVEQGTELGKGQTFGHVSGQSSMQSYDQEKAVALGVLMQAIERHKSYPKQARRTGAQGTVSLLVSVGQDGKVNGWEMRQGSGHLMLDSATRQLGEKLTGLDTGLRGKEFRIVVPVRYALS